MKLSIINIHKLIISLWGKIFHAYHGFFCGRNHSNQSVCGKIGVIYRISDSGYAKVKPAYINNENCLRNAVKEFPINQCHWHVIADNICDQTYDMIRKIVPLDCIERVSVGNGAGTFRLGYEYALQHFADNDCVYFLENDYVHKPGSLSVLKEGLCCRESDYVSLYDHPDKYGYNSDNKFVIGGGENTRVLLTMSSHWRITNSTTMTFAAFVSTLKKDKSIFWRWTSTKHPFDYQIFIELKYLKGRNLITPIPSYATHGEVRFLAPLLDWEKYSGMKN